MKGKGGVLLQTLPPSIYFDSVGMNLSRNPRIKLSITTGIDGVCRLKELSTKKSNFHSRFSIVNFLGLIGIEKAPYIGGNFT